MLPANLPPKCYGFTANANQPSSPDVNFLSTSSIDSGGGPVGTRGVAGCLYVEVGTGGGGGGGGGGAVHWSGLEGEGRREVGLSADLVTI